VHTQIGLYVARSHARGRASRARQRAISLDRMSRAARELARKFFADTLYDLLQTG
jgi:hypothetical protein